MIRPVLIVVLIAGAVLAGGLALYYLTMPNLSGTPTGSGGQSAGWQSGYAPQGIWADYLGYIPQGYNPAPPGVNAPKWPCPTGMSASACAQFHQTCGNGVCDPNESCSTCPIDCAPSGEATCDPYTGRAGAPISVCFLGGGG